MSARRLTFQGRDNWFRNEDDTSSAERYGEGKEKEAGNDKASYRPLEDVPPAPV